MWFLGGTFSVIDIRDDFSGEIRLTVADDGFDQVATQDIEFIINVGNWPPPRETSNRAVPLPVGKRPLALKRPPGRLSTRNVTTSFRLDQLGSRGLKTPCKGP